MSKFNENVKPERAMSYEGGENYKKDVLEDWMNFLFSSKMDDSFYENADTQQTRFIELTNLVIDKYGAEFAGKCAMFARNSLGMRSVSQLVAAMLNGQSFERKRDFYKAFCHRPDDMSEIFAAVDMLGGKRSHAMIRGFADYMSGLSEYNLMKYQMKGKRYNMYDLINIIHPKSDTVNDYMNGKLEAADTWEVNISTGKDSWKNMVEGNRLGYLALIRNLNNILAEDVDDKWIKRNLVDQLINEVSIKKSLVFPYQIYTAYRNLRVQHFAVITALDTAFRIACGNMPKLEGNSIIMLDVSRSMEDRYGDKSNLTIKEVGACYAAALYINGSCDFIKFGTSAKAQTFKKACGPFQVIREMCDNDSCGWGTNIIPAFKLITGKKYARIFIVSDMQVMNSSRSWYQETCEIDSYNDYCHINGRTSMYSFDLGNYHSQLANSKNPDVHLMTALNDNVFKMLEYVENGGKLYDYINDNYHF
jgi:hypothetical protein